MKIIRTSSYSGAINTKELEVTLEQLNNWQDGALIQDAMPNLTADDREFIKSGLTDDDWNNIFSGTKQGD